MVRSTSQSRSRENSGYLMADRYTVKRNGEILFENMDEIEYMDLMEDLAKEYYNTGSPKAGDIETIIIGETASWQKQKQVWRILISPPENPKSLGREMEKELNSPRRLATMPKNLIADRVGDA